MRLFFSNLFMKRSPRLHATKSNMLMDEFIKINGSPEEIITKINNFGLGYKIEQYKLSNSSAILNSVEICQIFGGKQLLELSSFLNIDKEILIQEIADKLYLLV